jgi:hypothetical protein
MTYEAPLKVLAVDQEFPTVEVPEVALFSSKYIS